MQFRWVMKSPLSALKLAHNFTCQQSAVQKVVSEIPGSRSYQATYENVLSCQWVSIQRSETHFQELCDLQGLTSKPPDWHSKRKNKVSNTNPACLSNANHSKKTVSLLRHIFTCHLKSEGRGKILHLSHSLLGYGFFTDIESKDLLNKKKEALFKLKQYKSRPYLFLWIL